MCRLASFIYNEESFDIKCYNLVSHHSTYSHYNLSERKGWLAGHYIPEGGIECRTENGKNKKAEEYIKVQWPKFLDFIEFAIKSGADINAKDDYGDTALILAARYKLTETVNILKAVGAK